MMINDAAKVLATNAADHIRIRTALIGNDREKAKDLLLGRMHSILLSFQEEGGVLMTDEMTDACATLLSSPGLRVMMEMRQAAFDLVFPI